MTSTFQSTHRALHGGEEFSFVSLWRVLVIRAKTIQWTVGIAMGLALAMWLLTPRQYAATAQLEINPENAAALDLRDVPPAASEDYAVSLATQVDVLQSDTLALQVIQQLNLEKNQSQRTYLTLLDPAVDESVPLEQSAARRSRLLKAFHKHQTVRQIGGTRILEVRYVDVDPDLAASVVNTLVEDYLEQYYQTRYRATRQASDWLGHQLDDLKNDLADSQQRLVDYQKQTGILGESETNNVVMAKLEELNKQLSAAQANRIVKQAVWELAKTGDPELISSVAGTSFLQGVSAGPNPTQLGLLPILRAQEAQLKADIAQNSARLGPNFPKLLQMKTQLSDLQSSIEAEIEKIAARAQNDYMAAKNAEDMERGLFEGQKQEANRLNDSAIQYGILKREADARRDLYEGLVGKLKQASVLASLRSSNILVVDPARAEARPVGPNLTLYLLLGVFGGFVFGVAIALVQDGGDTTLHTPHDVARVTAVRSISLIAQNDGSAVRQAEIDEQFRALRSSLLFAVHPAPQVIVVTSALPGEGKTTVSVQLARSLARQGRRVLLVDADLRRPSLNRELAIPTNDIGLSSLLDHGVNRPFHDDRENLSVLPAGDRPDLPAELLGSPRMTTSISTWRQAFDHIILDTPPLLAFTDATILAQHANAVLLVVRANRTAAESVQRAQELLAECSSIVPNVVLNGFNLDSVHYAYYFGYPHDAEQQLREYTPS